MIEEETERLKEDREENERQSRGEEGGDIKYEDDQSDREKE